MMTVMMMMMMMSDDDSGDDNDDSDDEGKSLNASHETCVEWLEGREDER